MHVALRIDEILQMILERCSDWSQQEYRWSLCQVARCCQAWKDPALDRLWYRLDSIKPLVQLVPEYSIRGNCFEEGSIDAALAKLRSYASRVRRIKQKEFAKLPEQLRPHILTPNLMSVRLSNEGCTVPPSWFASKTVGEVDVNTGLLVRGHSPEEIEHRCNSVANFLSALVSSGADVHTLRVRGRSSALLNRALDSLTTLRVVSLFMGSYLTAQTLATVLTLPFLRELRVDASCIDIGDFQNALPCVQFMPTLESLHIQADAPLITAVLQLVHTDALEKLHLEAISGPSTLRPVLDCLAQKAAASLQELVIQFFPDTDDMDHRDADGSMLNGASWFTISQLRPLACFRRLARFTIAATKVPQLFDEDVEEMSTWWPNLEHLDLGILECEQENRGPFMTPNAIALMTKSCVRLKTLTLPVDAPDVPDTSTPLPDGVATGTDTNDHERR
ncbi:hypothetical protein AcW1_006401 [Taiwanofungus camphoratus]|nr:hypothetical protein AcW1_006401 [Antrodia cinnamomea]